MSVFESIPVRRSDRVYLNLQCLPSSHGQWRIPHPAGPLLCLSIFNMNYWIWPTCFLTFRRAMLSLLAGPIRSENSRVQLSSDAFLRNNHYVFICHVPIGSAYIPYKSLQQVITLRSDKTYSTELFISETLPYNTHACGRLTAWQLWWSHNNLFVTFNVSLKPSGQTHNVSTEVENHNYLFLTLTITN